MAPYRRLKVTQEGPITIVEFVDKKIVDPAVIEELGDELFGLIGPDKKIVLNFGNVDFLSSATLNKLIQLNAKVRASRGSIKFSNMCQNLREVITITRLDKLFDVRETQADALAAFQSQG